MTRCARATLLALTLPFLPQALAAQSPQFGLGAGWYMPGGADFEDTDPGVGYNADVAFEITPRLSLGLGGQWSMHGVPFSTDKYDVVAVYAEPRAYLSEDGADARPFIGARLAWLRKAIKVGTVSRAASGLGGAAELGLELAMTATWALEGAVSGTYLHFSDFEAAGTTLVGTQSAGWALGLRLGIRVRS